MCPELHAEIDRLPEKYRLPIVLCYFEGLTHDQAASRLRWPVGTVKTRLSRGRDRLRARLEVPGTASVLPIATGSVVRVEWSERLLSTTARMGCRSVAGGIPGGEVSSDVIVIAREVMRSMLIQKLQSTATVLCGVFLLGFGALVAAQHATGNNRAMPPGEAVAETPGENSTLRLQGTTDYDPETVYIVRLPLDGRVDKVLVDLGSVIKKGDPLLEFFSLELAAAKSDYEVAASQWKHDLNVKLYETPLAKEGTLPKKELLEVENDEAQSRLKMKLAMDKLLLYGLTEQEIAAVKDEDGEDKARMILRARAGGVLVKRDVVQGNFYQKTDKLMTIVPLDHLWVRGRVGERDADKVQIGQTVRVIIPLATTDREIVSKIAYIDRAIDPETRSAAFRTTIPNLDGRYKAGMVVRLQLDTNGRQDAIEAPPAPGTPAPGSTTADRLDALERRLDRLLDKDLERSSGARILERLDALERKLDRLLDERAKKSP